MALPVSQILPEVQAQVTTTQNSDHLSVTFKNPAAFTTQSLDFSKLAYLRVWVKGAGLLQQVWNDEGFVAVTATPNLTLNIQRVPKGKNRIVAAIGYDAQKQPIPGIVVKGFYSSSSQPLVKVYLKWRFLAVGEILETLLSLQSSLAETIDTQQLQTLIDSLIYGSQPVDGPTYQIHPSRLNPQAIAQTLIQNQGALPLTPPSSWVPPNNSLILVVQNPLGQSFVQGVKITINDPISTQATIVGGNDRVTLQNLPPGSWTVTASPLAAPTVKVTSTLTVAPDGSLTIAQGSIANPLILPPVITSISGPLHPVSVSNRVGLWAGENNGFDSALDNHGIEQNGVQYATGIFGRAFVLDGINDFIEVPHHSSLNLTSSFTIHGWVKATSLATAPVFLARGTAVASRYGFQGGSNGALCGYFTGTCSALSNPGDFTAGRYHHVSYVFDDTNNESRLYLNGNLIKVSATAGNPVSNAGKLNIGRDTVMANFYVKGNLDEMALYNKALTSTELNALYHQNALTITGDGFSALAANNTVNINGSAAWVSSASPTTLIVTLPEGTFGTVPIQATLNAVNSNSVSYPVLPSVYQLNRSLARPGDTIALSGRGFESVGNNNTVQFNGQNATVTGAGNNTLTVTVPPATVTGPVQVIIPSGTSNQLAFTTIPADLLSWWQAESNGNDATAAHPATLFGDTNYSPGKVERGFGLDGAGDYIDLSNTTDFRMSTPKTITGWFKTSASGTRQMIIQKGDDVIGFEWVVEISPAGKLQAHFEVGTSGATVFNKESTAALNDGNWHHFAVIYLTNPAAENILLYVDGVEQTTASGDQRATLNYGTNNAKTTIGARSAESVPNLFFNGQIDEIQIYNRALSLTEIQSIYNASL